MLLSFHHVSLLHAGLPPHIWLHAGIWNILAQGGGLHSGLGTLLEEGVGAEEQVHQRQVSAVPAFALPHLLLDTV